MHTCAHSHTRFKCMQQHALAHTYTHVHAAACANIHSHVFAPVCLITISHWWPGSQNSIFELRHGRSKKHVHHQIHTFCSMLHFFYRLTHPSISMSAWLSRQVTALGQRDAQLKACRSQDCQKLNDIGGKVEQKQFCSTSPC